MTTTFWTLIIFMFMIISFVLNKIPMAVTSMIGLLLLVLTGSVAPEDALKNFGSSTVITMVSMFIVAAGLNRTQLLKHITKLVYKVAKGSFLKVLASYVIITFILGQFIPSIVALFALVSPLAINMCKEMKISPSKMIYSLGLTAVSASFAFLPLGPYAGGYIEDNGMLASFGYEGANFNIWGQAIVKIPVAIIVVLWAIFIIPKFIKEPSKDNIIAFDKQEKKTEVASLNKVQEFIGYVVFIFVILGLMFQPKIGQPAWLIAMIGAVILVVSGVLSLKEAIENMHIDIVLLYVGVVVLGVALVNTGAGELVGGFFAGMLGNTKNGYLIGGAFFFASFIMTSFLYNRAVSKVLLPLAILTSISLGCDPRGPITLCYIGSMSSLITPMATAVVPMMMGTGGYSQKDLLKLGLPISIVIGFFAVIIAMTIYPAF